MTPTSGFDPAGVFDGDYLFFYADRVGEERTAADVEHIWDLAALEPGLDVLDLGCGHGRIANRLAARGCRVTGLDATAPFLEAARADAAARGVEVGYVAGDMRALPGGPAWTAAFDRVLLWFTTFGYFDDDGNRAVLAEVARVLRPGGRLLVQQAHLPYVLRHRQDTFAVERDGDWMIDRLRFDAETGRLETARTLVRGADRRTVWFFVRLVGFPELRDWLRGAGFAAVRARAEDGAPLTADSPSLVAVATR